MNPAGVDLRILLPEGGGEGGNLKFSVACPPSFELAQGGQVVFHFYLPLRLNGFQFAIENCHRKMPYKLFF